MLRTPIKTSSNDSSRSAGLAASRAEFNWVRSNWRWAGAPWKKARANSRLDGVDSWGSVALSGSEAVTTGAVPEPETELAGSGCGLAGILASLAFLDDSCEEVVGR